MGLTLEFAMKVLILSQYYKPEPIPKPSELAEFLLERGHAASVVTGFPNWMGFRQYAPLSFLITA